MTPRIEKTVFISYRRTNFWTALAVFQNLHSNGYDVFFDYKSIPSGDFEQVITENIRSRAHFIIILSPSALDRCNEPEDWLRREIETAIDNKRNIIPLVMEGFDFGSVATTEALTGKLSELKKYNGLSIPAEYFDEAMTKLRSDRFLNRHLESISHPVSEVTKQITETQKIAAVEAKPVEKEQLTALEWFEQGYTYFSANNLKEALRCTNEAIKLQSDNGNLYFFRGGIYQKLKTRDKAIDDFTTALNLDANDINIWGARGMVYVLEGDYEKALEDLDLYVSKESGDPVVFIFRGKARSNKGDIEGAISDYTKAITIDPKYAWAYKNRAEARLKKWNIIGAISDYIQALHYKK